MSISETSGEKAPPAEKATSPETRTPVKKELAEIVHDFSETTTLHGLDGLFKKRKRSNPLKWKNYMFLVAVLGCLTFLGINLNTLGKDYLEYPVTTSIVRERRAFMELPAITICTPEHLQVSYQPTLREINI